MFYDTQHDANLYLSGTIVKYRGEPVYVTEVDDDMQAHYLNTNGRSSSVDVNSLDFTPIKLGYIFSTTANSAYYLQRRPSRQWRQGLSNSVCYLKNPKRDDYLNLAINGDVVRRITKDKYPTLYRAYRIAKSKRTEMPFTRELSVDYTGLVRYKTETVGSIRNGKIELLSPFTYLDDIIEEYMHEHFRHM